MVVGTVISIGATVGLSAMSAILRLEGGRAVSEAEALR
jgi:hypothetical protein